MSTQLIYQYMNFIFTVFRILVGFRPLWIFIFVFDYFFFIFFYKVLKINYAEPCESTQQCISNSECLNLICACSSDLRWNSTNCCKNTFFVKLNTAEKLDCPNVVKWRQMTSHDVNMRPMTSWDFFHKFFFLIFFCKILKKNESD